jgi:hypothetical protein
MWLAWTVVLAANLIVPLPLGLEITEGGGRIGMALAILAWWTLGLIACGRHPDLARSLIVGGLVVGLSQLVPVLQVAAGFAALGTWRADVRTFGGLDGFAVTALTGGELLAAAYACGRLALAVTRLARAPVADGPQGESRSG